MPSLKELRASMPELGGLDDAQAVNVIHQVYYPDLDRNEIAKDLGVDLAQSAKPAGSAPRKLMALTQGSALNDYVTEGVNAAAGGISAIGNFIAPGNRVSGAIDSFVEDSQANLTDAARQGKQTLAADLEAAQGFGDEALAAGKYVVQNPGMAVSQAIGSFVMPGAAIKGAGKIAQVVGAGAKGTARAGMAGGAVVGGAMAGGDAAGNAYDLVIKAGGTPEQAEEAARSASVIPAAVGAAGGLVGAERVFAGAKGFAGNAASRALKTGAVEAGQEGLEEGITQFEGRRAAAEFDPSIDPMKGVAGAATMGAILGGITGGGIAAITPGDEVRSLKTGGDGPLSKAVDTGLEVQASTMDAQAPRLGYSPLAGVPTIFPDGSVALDGEQADQKRINDAAQANVANAAQTQQPRLAGDMFDILAEAKAGGKDFVPVMHPIGNGFMVMPRQWVTPEMVAVAEQEIGVTINRMRGADAQPVVRAERRNSGAADVSINADPVAGYVDQMRTTNTPAARAFVGEVDAGRISRQDVEARMQAERGKTPDQILAEAAAQAPKPEAGLILNPQGKPFLNRLPAMIEQKKAGPGFEVQAVDGGFVVRAKEGAPQAPPQDGVSTKTGEGSNQSAPLDTTSLEAKQADDIGTDAGNPFKTKRPAMLKQKAVGGDLVQVQGGWVVRPSKPNATSATPTEAMNGSIGETAGLPTGTGATGALDATASDSSARRGADVGGVVGPYGSGADVVGAGRTGESAGSAVADGVGSGGDGAAVAPAKTFKTKKAADAFKKSLGNTHKLQKVKGGHKVRPKTDKEIEAERRAGDRLQKLKTNVEGDSLLTAIARNGGLAMREKADTITEGNANRGGKMVYRNEGKPIDIMAQALHEDGYIPPQEYESDGGVSWLQNATQEEYGGIRKHYSQNGEEWLRQKMAEGMGDAPDYDQAGADAEAIVGAGYYDADEDVQFAVDAIIAEIIDQRQSENDNAEEQFFASLRNFEAQEEEYAKQQAQSGVQAQRKSDIRTGTSQATDTREAGASDSNSRENRAEDQTQGLTAPTEADALKVGIGDFGDQSDKLASLPAGSWLLLDGRQSSGEAPQFQAVLSLGGGRWAGGDYGDTPTQAFKSGLKRWTDRGGDENQFKQADKSQFVSGIQNTGLLTAPARAQVVAQQDRADQAEKLDDKAQAKREVGDSTFMTGVTGDMRQDTTGDMFGSHSAPKDTAATLLGDIDGKTDGVSLVLESYTETEVELSNIEAVQKGQGAGSQAMRALTDAADKRGINLMLIPAGDPGTASHDGLVSFYERFGFELDGDVMRRRAKQVLQQAQPVGDTGVNARMVVIDKATADVGSDDGPMFSLASDTPIFYSELARQIEKSPMAQGLSAAWAQYLDALAKRGAIKADEVEWTGLRDWLGMQTSKVTKAQIAEFLDGNGVQVQEVVLGADNVQPLPDGWDVVKDEDGDGYFVIDDEGDTRGEGTTELEARRDAGDPDALNDIEPKYAKYTVPGGQNYREVLLTLPRKPHTSPKLEQLLRDYDTLTENYTEADNERMGDLSDAINTEREKLRRADESTWYKSSHWDQRNVLAHIRVDDRTDADGKRVLFVQEVQSDFGQDGKKNGFSNSVTPPTIEELKADGWAAEIGVKDPSKPSADPENKGFRTRYHLSAQTGPFAKTEAEAWAELSEQRHGAALKGAVPAAPFVGKTDAWVSLAIKRIIKMAADGGYDRVAFINGEQAADLYDLSKQISEINYEPAGDGLYEINAKDMSGDIILAEDEVTIARIEELVGKEMAKKIEAGEGEKDKDGYRDWHKLSGLDLKVGGAGMRTFYDQIVPKVAKDVLKKVGGGQLATVDFGAADTFESYLYRRNLELRDGKLYMRNSGIEMSLSAIKRQFEESRKEEARLTGQQTGFDITPAIRDKVSAGVPLFRRGIGPGITIQAAQAYADRMEQIGLNKVNVVESIDDMPAGLRDKVLSRVSDGNIRGVYFKDTDQVYVVTGNLVSPEEFTFVALHESFHRGLAKTLPGAKAVLSQIWLTNQRVKQLTKEQMDRHGIGQEEAIEEALADLAGEGKARDLKGWDKFVKLIQDWVSNLGAKLGIEMTWTDDMVEDFVAGITRAGLRKDGVHVADGSMMARMQESSKPGPNGERRTGVDQGNAAAKPFKGFGPQDHYTPSQNLSATFEPIGVKVKESGSSASGSRYVELNDPVSGEVFTVRFADHKATGRAIALHGVPTFEVGDFDGADFKTWKESAAASLDRINEARREYGDPELSPNDQSAPTSEGAMFSRGRVAEKARDLAFDLIGNAGSKVSLLDKTIKTQYAKAEKFPEYKRVFNKVQEYIEGVSMFANQAADNAPDILPKLESWRDLKRGDGVGALLRHGLSKADSEALAGPVFEGTLNWTRDEGGKLVKQETAQAAADKLTTEEMAQSLIRSRKLDPKVLRMWQGMDIDRFNTVVESKYEREMLRAGVVFSDAELKTLFKLTLEQIGHYRQFRASVDESLDQVAAAEVIRLLGKNAPVGLKDMVNTKDGRQALRTAVEDFLADDSDNADLWNGIADKFNKAEDLKARGYAPLMRFGKFSVHVADADGQTLYFGLEESRSASNGLARQLREEYPDAKVEQGVISEEAYKLMSQVPIDAMELFADAIGADRSEVFQKYIQLAKNNRSTMKRLMKRKGTAGFAQDAPRVLASFVTSNARAVSASMHVGDATAMAEEIRSGDVKDEAVNLVKSVTEPEDSAATIRGLMFVNFIGGSIASAVVNLTQPVMMTLPYLSQWGGMAKASARLASAAKMAATGRITNPEIREAIKKAEDDGIVSPQEIHHLMAQASSGLSQVKVVGPALQKLAFLWSAPFSLAEQFNRRASFIAAYQTALDQGISSPFAFAEKAVVETQGLYNTGNRMNWARNPVAASMLTFKQFSIHYLEWLGRMSKNGPEGKRAVAYAVAMLILAAGADGLPFVSDLDDIIDTIGQYLGYDMNSKRTRREFVESVVGRDVAPLFTRGFSAAGGFPVDVSVRMGMGNMLPGTDLMLKSNTDTARSVSELAGAAGGLLMQYRDASAKLLNGEVGNAVVTASPIALQNLAKAAQIYATGEYRDRKDRKVMDADGIDAGVKALGFQPAEIAKQSAKMGEDRRSEMLAKTVESEIVDEWARAAADGDTDRIQKAKQKLTDWNKDNPDMPIVIKRQQLFAKIKAMKASRQDRYLKTIAPERRARAMASMEDE